MWFLSRRPLSDLPAPVVIEAVHQFPANFVPKKCTCPGSVSSLLLQFCHLRSELGTAPNEALILRCLSFVRCPLPSVSRLCVVSGFIEMLCGVVVAAVLRQPSTRRSSRT
ncbi:hypothetical protein BDR03DRAFT_959506 [Suillus americanus]|nr:hypothetical protein BDR03DRAFT_959506 [Suillus americanus]